MIEAIDRKEIVLMGDLNCDYSDIDGIGHKMINDICDEFGLTQEIKRYTRVTHRSFSLINSILTNGKNISYTGCVNYNISDHCPVFIVKTRVSNARENECIYRRTLRDFDTLTLTANFKRLECCRLY